MAREELNYYENFLKKISGKPEVWKRFKRRYRKDFDTRYVCLTSCDLSNLNLEGFDFSGLNFDNFEARNIDFQNTSFMYSNFQNTSFKFLVIVDSNFKKTGFSKADFSGADFEYGKILGSDFSEILFEDVNLKDVNFKNFELDGVDFRQSIFSDINFENTNFYKFYMSRVNLDIIIYNTKLNSSLLYKAKNVYSLLKIFTSVKSKMKYLDFKKETINGKEYWIGFKVVYAKIENTYKKGQVVINNCIKNNMFDEDLGGISVLNADFINKKYSNCYVYKVGIPVDAKIICIPIYAGGMTLQKYVITNKIVVLEDKISKKEFVEKYVKKIVVG